MNNSLRFKFDFQTETEDCAYSLMSVIMENIKSFPALCKGLELIEVSLFQPETQGEDHKTALFKLVSGDTVITEYSRSKRWEDAILNAFDKIKARFLVAA